MAKKQHYKYVIETDSPVWPRHIADDLMNSERFAPTLVSVTDLQNDGHIYGERYNIRPDERSTLPRKRTMVLSN